MNGARALRTGFLWLALSLFAPPIPAQQGGQTGSGGGGGSGGAGGGTGGGTGGGASGSTSGTGTGNTTGRSTQATSPVQPASPSTQARQRQQMPFISGVVVMEDGSPVPMGVVIERICNGNKTRESHVSSGGSFSFQAGANAGIMMDASESGWGNMDGDSSALQMPGPSALLNTGTSSDLMGCELKADLPGYRSNTIMLSGLQGMGRVIDVGTIVLHPIAKVQGTTVSATSLRAPKDAKRAMERGWKALRKGKAEEAEKDLQAAVEIYPAYADAWFSLGRLYQQQGRAEDARIALSRAREADSSFVLPYVELARLAAVEKKWQETADLTDRALALNPLDIPDGFFLNSLAYFNLRNFEAAERSARKTQRLDSLHRLPTGHLILASILRQRQDYAGEAEQLRYYLKYAPQATNAEQVRTRLKELESLPGVVTTKQRSQQ